MKRTVIRFLAVTLAAAMLLAATPTAATTPKGSDYTANKTVAARLDVVFATYGPGAYFTYDGKPCTDHNTNPHCANGDPYGCNCRRVLDDGTDMLAWQCFGYARYVFYTLFGFIDNAATASRWVDLGSIPAGEMSESSAKSLLLKAKTGAHIRTNSKHSMAVLSVAGDGITVIHANIHNNCDVVLQRFTWSQFVSFYGRNGIEYVHMPKVYPGDETDQKNVAEGIYTLQNVSTGRALQVAGGKDTSGAAVNTGALNAASKAQQFKLVYRGAGLYALYAVCSSNGQNRVVDIIRSPGTSIPGGNFLELWTTEDPGAQQFRFLPRADGSYTVEVGISPGVVMADKAKTSDQITVEKADGSALQGWRLTRIDAPSTTEPTTTTTTTTKPTQPTQPTQPPAIADGRGVVRVTVDDWLNLREKPNTSCAVLGRIYDGVLLAVRALSGEWGQVTFDGKTGWIALEYTEKVTALGDTDGSGALAAADALMALQHATGKIGLTAAQKLAADVDGDGTVSAGDALRILQFVTGKVQSL